MGQKQGEEAQLHVHVEFVPDEDKQQQHGNAGDNLRVDDGQVGDVHHQAFRPFFHAVDSDGRQCANHRRHHRGDSRDDKGVEQGGEDHLVVKQFNIPIQGEAGEHPAGFALIKGEHNQHQDGQVKEAQRHRHICFGIPASLFHMIISSLSSPSNWLVMLMQRRIRTISTKAMAAPRLGL